MGPLQAGGSRLWRAAGRSRRAPLTSALALALILAAILGQSSLATAQQTTSPSQDPGFFPATGYRISSPAILDTFQRHGGVRTLGYPVSSEFPLLGQRVQIFQRTVLQEDSDGNVQPLNILSNDILPITHIDGLSLPPDDPDVVAAAPSPDAPEYTTQALAFINVYVPDSWNGMQVNFQQTFLDTVTCADAFGTDTCDPSQLPAMDLDVWGLPTSLPMSDPLNPDFVYQRFQRGIMHFSANSGLTQGLLLGDWLKRVMIGVDLSPDLNTEVRQSRFFAQYAPSRPLALDRPTDLPDTSLAQAFRSDTLTAAGQGLAQQAEPTLPTNVAQTATSVALTSTAVSATQVALTGQQNLLTATALALTATASTASQQLVPTATAVGIVSSIPVVNIGCLGDEQMWFVPRRPNVGVHVSISVTSQRHHDAHSMALGGPLDAGPVVEHQGPLGFIWTWTVVPPVEAFYQWTFFADGLRPCITSGFNAFAPLGATPTPTITPEPTNTPGTATPTPTATSIPVPQINSVVPNQGLTCNEILTITGNNFGSPPSNFGTTVFMLQGTRSTTLTPFGTGSNTQLRVQTPGNTVSPGPAVLQVSNNGGDSTPVTVNFTTGCA
jgi:IPT/TIG domain-containing protein